MQYEVLQTLSPQSGPLLFPGAIVDETVVSAEAAPILLAMQVIAPVPATLPEITPDLFPDDQPGAEPTPPPDSPDAAGAAAPGEEA